MSDEERDATIAYLRQRMEMAELRAMEMEGRYDRLTADYGEKVKRLAEADALMLWLRSMPQHPLAGAKLNDYFGLPADYEVTDDVRKITARKIDPNVLRGANAKEPK